jgi:hypothetical protein
MSLDSANAASFVPAPPPPEPGGEGAAAASPGSGATQARPTAASAYAEVVEAMQEAEALVARAVQDTAATLRRR